MTGSSCRGMPLSGDLSSCGHYGYQPFSKAHWASWLKLGLKWVALARGPWYWPILYPERHGMHSILCPHPNSLRTNTSVEGVSVLQSWTTIHVTTIPNHEAVISFWGGKQGVNLYATVTRNLFIQIKIFVNMLLLLLSPMNENLINPGTHVQKQEWDISYKNFYYDLYNAKPVRSTDWAVKENY